MASSILGGADLAANRTVDEIDTAGDSFGGGALSRGRRPVQRLARGLHWPALRPEPLNDLAWLTSVLGRRRQQPLDFRPALR